MRPGSRVPVGIMFPLHSLSGRGGWSQGWLVGGDAGKITGLGQGIFLPLSIGSHLLPRVLKECAAVSFSRRIQGHSAGAGELPVPRSFAHLEAS